MNKNSFMSVMTQRFVFLIFLLGKIFRFITFGAFLLFLLKGTGGLGGYNINQVLFFYLTFIFVDSLAQVFFREVYRFRPLVISGDLDLILVKPINVLVRVLFGGTDFIDLASLPIILFFLIKTGQILNPNLFQVILFVLLMVNGLVIAMAFHIAVISFGIITLEIDHTILIYRDLLTFARFPIDIYKEPLKSILTYIIPVGVMITMPAKALMGIISPSGVVGSFLFGGLFLFLSLRFWNFALTKYTSASS